MNKAYGSYLSDNYPARATIQVAALPLNASVEIEMIAKIDR
ncbi:MAG: RidA family protein [Candidatus Heimdallarchaeota archaeon]